MLAIFLFLILALAIRIAVVRLRKNPSNITNEDEPKIETSPNDIGVPQRKPNQIEIERDERIKNKRQEFRELFNKGFNKASIDKIPLFIFIDFETTDLPPDFRVPSKANLVHYPYIVQAACLVFNESGELIDEFSSIIKTPEDVNYDPKAVNIHKISKKKSMELGVDILLFFEFISKYCHDNVYIVAHNVQFDNLLLQVEAKRNSIRLPRYKKYCTMKSTKELVAIWNYDYTKYKLPKLRELVEYVYYDSEHVKNAINFHDAATDIKLCAMCFFELELDKDCESCK